MKYALITGGATGIGRGFANGLADLGYNLIITSRKLENLAQAKKEIEQKYSVQVLVYVADLKDESQRNELIEYAKNYNIKLLVNNAGIGENNEFSSNNYQKEKDLIDLNITAMHHLFKHYYTKFKAEEDGRIINVSSMASFVAGPYAATYYATKAYVTSITQAVSYEAKESGVVVQAVCPGSTKSEFYKTAGTNAKYYKANPDIVARKTIESKRTIVVPGFKNKLNYVCMKLLPYKLVMRVAARRQLRQKKDS